MNNTQTKDVMINTLLDELKEVGFSKIQLIEQVRGKRQNEAIDYLKTIMG